MYILAMNQFFWPDTAATGQFLADVTSAIDPTLHLVTVLCGTPDYGAIDAARPPAVNIVRLGSATFSRRRGGRLVSYASFFAAAALRSVMGPKPAIVLTLTTPPLISVLGTILKRLRGSRHVIWEMDMYPDVAVDLNVLKARSFVTRLIGTFADFSRKRADAIIVLGQDMKDRLVARGIPQGKIFIAENWADGCEIWPNPFKEGPLVVHYSGTFGLAHDEDTIAATLWQLRGDNRFRFIFSGGGARRRRFEEFCRAEQIDNVEFQPYVKRSDLSRSFAEGHLGLVTQKSDTVGSVVPSKVYGIMAAGRPVLYIGPEGTTPARIIQQFECGWRIEPGDAAGLVRLLDNVERNRLLLANAGTRARGAFEKHYDKPIGVRRVLSILGVSDTSTSSMMVGFRRVRDSLGPVTHNNRI
jgi:glycosyltransferase involved in cell wall biosynthesis